MVRYLVQIHIITWYLNRIAIQFLFREGVMSGSHFWLSHGQYDQIKPGLPTGGQGKWWMKVVATAEGYPCRDR